MRISLILFIVFVLMGCTTNSTYVKNEGLIFGTIYHLTYQNEEDLSSEIIKVLNEFDYSLSTYKDSSVISKINSNRSKETDKYFRNVITRAKEITVATNGAFDMTVAPLVNAWGFGFSKKDSITQELVDSLLQNVGMDLIHLEGDLLVKDRPGVMLDGSAIAKGYAVDVVADFLESKGIDNYMVEIGGEMRVKGISPSGQKWRVGIDKPIDDPAVQERELQEVIDITNVALATSGNYRNFYMKDGIKYAHTISPFNGYPVVHQLLGASVLAPDCMTADAYATAFMVLGVDKAMNIVNNNPELEAYFISSTEEGEYKIEMSAGFKQYIEANK